MRLKAEHISYIVHPIEGLKAIQVRGLLNEVRAYQEGARVVYNEDMQDR